MATYSTNRKARELSSGGVQYPETEINSGFDNFDKQDAAVGIAVTGGTVVMTEAQQLNGVITLGGTLTSNLSIMWNAKKTSGVYDAGFSRRIIFSNATSGSFTVTVYVSANGTTAAGTGIVLSQGKSRFLWHDDTNVYGTPEFTSSTGLPSVYAARVYNSASISIPNNSETLVTFDSEVRDDGSIHSTGSNTGELVAPVPGWYVSQFGCRWANNATGLRQMTAKKIVSHVAGNAVGVTSLNPISGNETMTVYNTPAVYLAAGEAIGWYAFQNCGGALNIERTADYSPEAALILVARTS